MDPTDNDAAHVWLSYAEAAAALGISARAVEGRAYRAGWAKRPGNDGTVRLAVPRNALGTPRHGAAGGNAPPRGSTNGLGHGSMDAPMVQVLVEELKASHAQAMADRQRDLESLRGQLADASKAQSHAEGEAVALREALTHERAQVAAERQRVEALQAERDRAQADLSAWTAGGPLARAIRGFLNRRGG